MNVSGAAAAQVHPHPAMFGGHRAQAAHAAVAAAKAGAVKATDHDGDGDNDAKGGQRLNVSL